MMKAGKKVLLLCLCLTMLLSMMTAVTAGAEEEIMLLSSTPLYHSFENASETDAWTNGTRTAVAEAGANGNAMKVTGLAKGTRLTMPAIDWKKQGLYTVTGKMKASQAATFEICLNMGIFVYQSTNGATAFNYQYPNARIDVGKDWTDFTFTVEIFDFVTSGTDSTPTGMTSKSAKIFLTPTVEVASDFIVYLEDIKIEEDIKVYSGESVRTVVYQENFEDGIGAFSAQSDPMILTHEKDGDNGYGKFALNADQAEAIATKADNRGTHAAIPEGAPGGWKGGRWSTEFYHGAFNISHKFELLNDKNYQIKWLMGQRTVQEGGSVVNEQPAGSNLNAVVLQSTTTNIYTSETATAAREVYPTRIDGTEEVKPGFYQYSNNISAYKFGTKEADGSFSGSATMNYWQIRTRFAAKLAQLMADNKLYCGTGTGAYNGNGVLQTGEYWGNYYKFTLDYDDFYGDETLGKGGAALFTEGMSEAEKQAVMDTYIYEDPDAAEPVKKEWTLAYDCSFLYSPTRIQKMKELMENFSYYYVVDDFQITADAKVYQDTVTITGQGTVTALTNPATEETAALTESGAVVTNDYFGVTYTVTPAEGYTVESVTYGDSAYTLDGNNQFTIEPEAITEGKALDVVFKSTAPVAPSINKTATIETNETYNEKPSAVVYTQVSAGSEEFSIEKMGSILSNGTVEVELLAKASEEQNLTSPGYFGIRVYGEEFKGGTYFFKPFVTYSDGLESKTVYAEESEFTLGTAEE